MTTQKHISYSAFTADKRSNIKFIFTINNKQPTKQNNKQTNSQTHKKNNKQNTKQTNI